MIVLVCSLYIDAMQIHERQTNERKTGRFGANFFRTLTYNQAIMRQCHVLNAPVNSTENKMLSMTVDN